MASRNALPGFGGSSKAAALVVGASTTAAVGAALVLLRPGMVAALAVAVSLATLLIAAELGRRSAVAPAFGALALGACACLLLWPLAAVVLAVVALVSAIALRAPVAAFLAALLVLGSEGILKARLTAEQVPSPEVTGALVADALLLLGLVGLVAVDRGRAVSSVWHGAGRAERVTWSLLAVWLVVSIVQVPLSPSLTDAVQGLRLTQGYVPLVAAGIILFAASGDGDRRVRTLLWVFSIIAAYAALLAFVDPPTWHMSYAIERSPHVSFGGTIRDFGSFSSVIALASFLVPVSVFSLILALLRPELRVLGATVFMLSAVAIVASYVRIAIVGLGVGAAVAVVVLVSSRATARRLRALAVGMVIVVAGGVYAGALAASDVTSTTQTRARGLTDPLRDESIRIRWNTWQDSLDATRRHLVAGTGIGTVGNATREGRTSRYTDNSYLKVLQEQGIVLGTMFIVGLLGAIVLSARRLARIGATRRPIGVAALGAVVSFLTLCMLGEYIEQAGKAVFWTMLGIVLWFAYGAAGSPPDRSSAADVASA